MESQLREQTLPVNGVRMHVVEQGEGPLIVLCHGWPELWTSWRHQLPALAAAGYRAVAPDMRGFGETEAPEQVERYTILHTAGDVISLVAALGEKEAVVVGHDWGAPVAWTAAMLRPDIVRAVVGMSVPHRQRTPQPPLQLLRQAGLHNFYWIYFQTPGVAEAEFERDVDATMRKLLFGVSGEASRGAELLIVPEGQGFLDRVEIPPSLPGWLREQDVRQLVDAYRRTGFRGGLNWYRNLDRNWELTAAWQDAVIRQPALFIAGAKDPVIAGPRGEHAIDQMSRSVPNVRKLLIEGAGHWIQQERPEEVNAALLQFLAQLR